VLADHRYDLINFIAVEPIVRGQRGFSELERSEFDKAQGKRLWAENPGGLSTTNLIPGQLRKLADGHEELELNLRVEKFENGAHVRLVVRQSCERPDEIELSVFQEPDSTLWNTAYSQPLWVTWLAPASSGSKTRWSAACSFCRLQRDRVYSAPGIPLSRLQRNAAGGVLVAVTNDEENPASVYPFPGSEAWHYAGMKVTQMLGQRPLALSVLTCRQS
jgi:hypothetical protein